MGFDKITYPEAPLFIDGHWENLVHFKENWNFSHGKLTKLNEILNSSFATRDFSIAVAGSYGRMEASNESDLDFFVLSNNVSQEVLEEIQMKVKEIAKELAIKLPNIDGVFSGAFTIKQISKIGDKEDDLFRLAQRMLLLMESRAIYNEDLYKSTVRIILEKYLEYVIKDPKKEALFLLNDLIRYFRSIAVNYQHNFWKDNQKWVIRNVKLRHSRVLIYAGLLLLILNGSKHIDDKFDYFHKHIHLTPIEKILSVYIDNKDYTYERLLGAYDIFLGKINDSEVRSALQADYNDRYQNPHYAQLKVTSDMFISELTRFIFAQRKNWTPQIMEYLIF